MRNMKGDERVCQVSDVVWCENEDEGKSMKRVATRRSLYKAGYTGKVLYPPHLPISTCESMQAESKKNGAELERDMV